MQAQSDRRELLRAGLGGFSALSLPGLLKLRAEAALKTSPQSKLASTPENTAIILVWLRGGASHLDTFDPKPDAPSDYRGPFSPIATNVPGIQISDLLPKLSVCADRYSLVRSLSHTGGGHPAGSLQMLSGDPDARDKPGPRYPDWMSVAHSLRFDPKQAIPNYIALNPVDRYDSFTIAGPTYLGGNYAPFKVKGDASKPSFQIPNIGNTTQKQRDRLSNRVELRKSLDLIRRDIEHQGMMNAMDQFETQAMNLILSPQAREAFDLSREPTELRERYGMNQWGQQCLMARRLIEAGVEIITTEFDGPLCGRVANWDDHAVNHHVFNALEYRMPFFDQAVSALIEDVYSVDSINECLLLLRESLVARQKSVMSPAVAAALPAAPKEQSSRVAIIGHEQVQCFLRVAVFKPVRSLGQPMPVAKTQSPNESVRKIFWQPFISI